MSKKTSDFDPQTVLKIFDLMSRNALYNPWVSEADRFHFFQEIKGEWDEAEVERQNGDIEAFAEELGDIFWDLMSQISHLDQKGLIDKNEWFEQIFAKFTKRAPYLMEGKTVSHEERLRLWKEGKEIGK